MTQITEIQQDAVNSAENVSPIEQQPQATPKEESKEVVSKKGYSGPRYLKLNRLDLDMSV